MKLAEALQERADLKRSIEELKNRLSRNALVQEGEAPAEDPEKLRRAYTGRLRLLSGRFFRGTAGSTEKHTYGLRYSGQLRP